MEIDYKALFKWQQQSNAYYLRVCDLEKREADLEAKVERLETAIKHCDPLCPAWAALEEDHD